MFCSDAVILALFLLNLVILQFAVLRVLGGFSSGGNVMPVTMDMLASAKLQLKKLLVSFTLFLYSIAIFMLLFYLSPTLQPLYKTNYLIIVT